MEKLNVGVVGVGHLGSRHARVYSHLKNTNLIGVCDVDKKRAKRIGRKHKVWYFADYRELFGKVQAVSIVVPTSLHHKIAKDFLNAGIHVLVEKPITKTLEEADELITIAGEKNLILQVGHIERFNPVILQIADKIKDPVFAECHRIAPFTPRGSDVPVVLELMIHDLDLILSFINSDLVDIRASGAGVMTKSIDIANARLDFANGAVANITASRISMKRSRQLRFFQKDSYFSIDFQDKKVKYIKKSPAFFKVLPKIMKGKYEDIKQEDVVDISEIDASDSPKDALTLELESFIEASEKGKKQVVDGKAGTRALKIALEIVEKIQKK